MKQTKNTQKSNIQNSKANIIKQKLLQKEAEDQSDKHTLILKNLMEQNFAKPTNVEAQRIIKIIGKENKFIDEMLLDMEILTYLDSDFISNFINLENLGQNLDEEKIQLFSQQILKILSYQAKLENKFTELTDVEDSLYLIFKALEKESAKESFDQEYQEEIDPEEQAKQDKEKKEREEKREKDANMISKQLNQNLQILIRYFKNNDKEYQVLKALNSEIIFDMQEIFKCVKSLKYIMLKKLSTAAEEADQHVKQLHDLNERIASLEKSKKTNELELEKLKKERTKYCTEKKEQIEKLKQSLEAVKNLKKKRETDLENDIKSQQGSMEKQFKLQEDKLNVDIAALKQQMNKLREDNTKEETDLKRKKQNTDSFYSECINQYDQIMEQWRKDKKQMQDDLNRIDDELKNKKEYFITLDQKKYRELQVETEFEQKRKAHQLWHAQRKEFAIRIEQAWIRFKKGKKKKKGKAKKGKK